jgi:hypothetical protein
MISLFNGSSGKGKKNSQNNKVLVMAGLTRHLLKTVKHQYSKFHIIINGYRGIEGLRFATPAMTDKSTFKTVPYQANSG